MTDAPPSRDDRPLTAEVGEVASPSQANEQAVLRWGEGAGPVDAPPTALLEALADSDLLPGLAPQGYLEVADEIAARHLDAGDVLVQEGDVADRLYVVITGRLEVVLDTARGSQGLSHIGPGGIVGEIGLLAGDTRSATVRASVATEVVELSAVGLRRLMVAHPGPAEALAARATQRLRRTQVIARFTELFGVIDPTVLEVVEQLVEWVNLPAGAQLFAQGDVGDAAYLVAAGRLRAYRRTSGVEVELGEIGRAELVGELSLLDDEPRSASVYAVRDTQLIQFSRSAYEELLDRYPRVGLEVAQIALRRARSVADRHHHRLSVVVVPISPGVDVSDFVERLTPALGPTARRISSTAIDEELGRDGIAQIGEDDVGTLRLAYHLEELEEQHEQLVYEIDGEWTAWSRRALRWADHILLVGDAERDHEPGPLEQELWSLVAAQHHPRVSLALLHPAGTKLPTGTMAWLQHRRLASHHHVRRGDQRQMERLGRLLAGRGVSLVFGGGGARGFAQLGVLSVMEEQGAPIDMLGGTSIGAIMAVGPGMGWTAGESRHFCVRAFQKLFDYTWPRTSLLRGARITARIEEALGDTDIADLWVPYFCVSTNLTHAQAVYHDHGPLVRAIRASIAIPGVLPPVPMDGDLLVDGGLLDNVPVAEMRRRNPTGTVIAVDVAPVDGPVAESDFGLSVSGFRNPFRRRDSSRPPALLATMVRSTILASVRDRQRVVEDGVADLYLDVDVEGGGMLDFSTGGEIADGGAESTREALADWFAPHGDQESRYVRTTPPRRSIIDPERRSRGGGVLLLTLRDLQHRAARFAAVVVGVSVVFSVLFLMTGLTEQFHREPAKAVAGFGAEGWLLRDGASGAFTSAATMPAVTADLVGGGAAPVIVARHSLTDGAVQTDVVVVGFTPGALGEPELSDGRLPEGAGEIVIDDASDLAVGDETTIGNSAYVVTGHTDHRTLFAGMPFVFMGIGDAEELLYRGEDLASAILLDEAVDEPPEGFVALSNDTVAEDALRPLEKSVSSVNMIRILLWFVAAMIIGTMTYLSSLERRRDVAVLKAVGGSTTRLGASIALQGVLTALVAAALAAVLQRFLTPVFPLEVSVPSRALLEVPIIAVVVALLAGIVGLRKAIRVDPALAFGTGLVTVPLLQVRDLVIEYASSGYAVRPIDGLDLDGHAGELIVLLGPSGCGKTSLLSALGGILRPTAGSIRYADLEVCELTGSALADYRQRRVGFVFQAFNLIPSLNARENVAIPLIMAGLPRKSAMRRADELLLRVGLGDRAHHKASKLSGGQQQRVAVARGLAADPGMLLADEPTANLDFVQAEGIISLLRELRSDGRLIIVSSHDDRLVPIADRVIHLVPEFRDDEQAPRPVEVAAGEVVFEQGTRGELVYVIESGRVEVFRQRADGTSEPLAELGDGDYFGELGPLLGFPRSATVRALTPLRLVAYNVHDFREQVVGTTAGASRTH